MLSALQVLLFELLLVIKVQAAGLPTVAKVRPGSITLVIVLKI